MQISNIKQRDCFSVYMDKHKQCFIVISMILFSMMGWLNSPPQTVRFFDGIFIGLLLMITFSALMLILLPKVQGWRRVEKNGLIFITIIAISMNTITYKHGTPWLNAISDFLYIMRLTPLFLAIYYLRRFINLKIFLVLPIIISVYLGRDLQYQSQITEGILAFVVMGGIYSAFYLLNGCKSSKKINISLYILMYFAMCSYLFFWLVGDQHQTWLGIFTYYLIYMKVLGPIMIVFYVIYEILELTGGVKRIFQN